MTQWFSERCPMWPGMALSVEVEAVLLDVRSRFQHIQVFRTATYGHMLVLDGKIQCTERDEYAYHEMIVHPAMFCHPAPKRVLIIGGGDGGAAREAVRHPEVESVIVCEIDPGVTDAAKRFLPGMAAGLTHPKVEVYHADAVDFLPGPGPAFDIIIVDAPDAFGPAKALFEKPFYQLVSERLTPRGVASAQAGHFLIHSGTVRKLSGSIRAAFPVQTYLFVIVPSYPGGGVGIALAAKSPDAVLDSPLRTPSASAGFRYYSPGIHRAAGILPAVDGSGP